MSKALTLWLLLAAAPASYAQLASPSAASSQADGLTTFFTSPEKVLPRLYEAAIAHSGEIERVEATKQVANEDLKLTRKRLLSTIGLASNYSYGTTPFYGGSESPTYFNFNPFSYGARSQYLVGVNAVVPLDLLLMRNTMVRRQEQVVNQAAGMRKVSEATIRQQVIVQYQALVLARATQQAAQEAWQSASINKKIADKRFRDGDIQIDEQMAVQDFYSKAVQAQAEAQNRYQTAQLLLEDMIGTSINNIILGK